jgi:hypothetical protein
MWQWHQLAFCMIGNFIAWLACVITSTKVRAAAGMQAASLLNVLRGKAVWSNRRTHHMRIW